METMSSFSPMSLRRMTLRSGDLQRPDTTMHRYQVYWVDLNPTKGAEIKKKRPCVIISPDELNKHLKTVVIAPLISRVREYYPFRLKVEIAGKEGQIAVDQIRVVDKSRLLEVMGELTDEEAKRLRDLLNEMFCVE